jgi:Ser/Thr protein kinase RdoA (MazF antagonist)
LGQAEEVTLRSALDLSSLETGLRAVLRADRGGRRDPVLAALVQAVDRHARATVRVTTLHWDFLPQNLFLCGERTIGIDFTLNVTGPALRDVGTFLANVLWRGYSTLDPGRSARFGRDVDAFLDAYYEGRAAPEREIAHLFILSELARKAQALSAKIAGRRLGTSARVHRLMIVGAIRRLLRCDRGTSAARP